MSVRPYVRTSVRTSVRPYGRTDIFPPLKLLELVPAPIYNGSGK